jgi:aryl-alcohol dehydrogenase-like predicted oxidoreductase
MKDAPLSRREILSAGIALGAGLALVGSASAASRALAPITRPIPSTGERLPVIGLGTNQYGVESPEEVAGLRQVLGTMADMGGGVVDTARAYGRSEEVIGELLERMGNRKSFFISTKSPIGGKVGDPDAEVQAAFDRLRVDVIDLMLIHNLHGLDDFMPAFVKAKREGRIRYIGMSTSVDEQYEALMEGMRRYPLDFIQVDYSIANRTAEERVLPLAQERGMAVLANMPFGGRRRASTTFGKVAGEELPRWAADFDATSWAQLFLKYVVSHPAVTVAIPGTTKVKHLVDNQGAGRGRLPEAAMRRAIERYWDAL